MHRDHDFLKMARYALIRNSDSKVDNIVEWDGDTTKWAPPATQTAIQNDVANVGDTWNGSSFVPGALTADPFETARQRIRQIQNAGGWGALTTAQQNQAMDGILRLLVKLTKA